MGKQPRAGELTTTNYGWTKPTVGSSDDAWGSYLNTDLDAIDSVVHGIDTRPGASPSGTLPIMDGTANAGSAAAYARGDHVHPTDTSRYAASNPAGYQTAPQVNAVLPAASTATPFMDGLGAIGVGTTWARADHVHPSDTSLYPASNPNNFQTGGQVTAQITSALTPYALITSVPVASSATPLVDAGPGSVGASTAWARADHVHPFPTITYGNLPAEVQQLPVAFSFQGQPAASAMVNVVMVMAVTVASVLAGSKGISITAATASAQFKVNKISGGTTTALGTATFAAAGKVTTFAGAGGSLAVGDILQIVAPTTADVALADVGITVLAMRT